MFDSAFVTRRHRTQLPSRHSWSSTHVMSSNLLLPLREIQVAAGPRETAIGSTMETGDLLAGANFRVLHQVFMSCLC